jgi:hypothetical protein
VSRLLVALVGLVGLVVAVTLVLSGCAVPPGEQSIGATAPHVFPGAMAAARTSARPTVAVLGLKLAKPSARPTATTRTPAPRTTAPAPQRSAPRKATGGSSCVVGKPCTLAGLTWTKSYGCTAAWRRATGQQCPPGWQPLP